MTTALLAAPEAQNAPAKDDDAEKRAAEARREHRHAVPRAGAGGRPPEDRGSHGAGTGLAPSRVRPVRRPVAEPAWKAVRAIQRSCECGGTCGSCAGEREPAKREGRDEESGPMLADAGKPPPTTTFEECPDDWQAEAKATMGRARTWVTTALANVSPAGRAAKSALIQKYFHSTDNSIADDAVKAFTKIQGALGDDIEFDCETSCSKDVMAYVRWLGHAVHLCPGWHNLSDNGKTEILIHELAHKAAGADDEAYCMNTADFNGLEASTAVDNADSLATFASEGATGSSCFLT